MTLDQVQELLTLLKLNGLVRSQNVQIPCPFAAVSGHRHMVDRNPSLGFLPTGEDAIWNCFACGRRGRISDFLDLAERELGFAVEAARQRLKEMLKKSPEDAASSIPAYEDHFKPNPRKQYPTFPDTWMAPYAKRVPQYILDRGVTIESCKRYGIGYDRFQHRVVFPVRDLSGALVGAVGGLTHKPKSSHIPKYKNYWHRVHKKCRWPLEHRDGRFLCPSCGGVRVLDEDVGEGFRKSNFLYGEWLLPKRPVVIPVVVEGIIDSITVWQAVEMWVRGEPGLFPLALFGSEPSKEQADKIVRYATHRKVMVWMDNDTAGRTGDKAMKRLLKGRVQFFRPQYPPDTEGSDPGSLTVRQIREAIRQAKVVL